MVELQFTAADLAALFEALNRHDIDAAMAYFAQDCVCTATVEPGAGTTTLEGIGAIAAEFSGVWREMKDARWDHVGHVVYGARAASEWTFSGTTANGRCIEADGCDLLLLDGGKIARRQTFRQNRMSPELVGWTSPLGPGAFVGYRHTIGPTS